MVIGSPHPGTESDDPSSNGAGHADGGDRQQEARLVRHGMLQVVGRLTIGAIGLVLVPVMLDGLGAEVYGLWIAALALCELWASIDLGLGWSLTREVARDPDGPQSVRFANSAANALLLLGLVGALAIVAAGWLLTDALGLGPEALRAAPSIFLFMGVALAGEAVIGYQTAVLYGLRQFGRVTVLHLALAAGRATGLVTLLVLGYGIGWLAAWYAMSTWLLGVLGLLVLAGSSPAMRFRLGHLDLAVLRQHAAFSIASQVTALGTSALWKAPTLMLGVLRNAGAIVPYHLGLRLPSMAYGIGWQAAEAVFPAATQDESTDDLRQGRQTLLVGTRWSILLTLPMLLIMSGIAPWFLELWLGEASPEVVAVLRVTAASALVHLLGATALHVLWGRGRAVEVAVVVSAMAAAILVSAVLLVPDFGALGAAWSTFVPMLIGSIYLVRSAGILCEVSQFEVLRKALRGLLFPSVVTLLVALLLPQWLGTGGWLSLLATCIAAGLLFFTAFFTLGKGQEERRLLFDVFFRGRRPGGDKQSPRPLRMPRWLRSVRDFLANLRFYLYDETHTRRDYYEALFRNEGDPWRYETMPERGANRHAGAMALLEAAMAAPRRFDSGLEVGCAEGLFTKPLATRCRRLLAVDISDIALARARDNCRDSDGVEFRSWDLLRDPLLPERFDLVVVMGVLDNFVRLGQLRLLRERIVALLTPGGYLLVESTRMGGDLEDSWWRRALHRGKWLNHYVAQHPSLETVDVRIDTVCVQTLLRKWP